MLEKTLESLLDSNEIKPVNPKGNQPWIFIRRTDAEAEAPILWPPDVKSQLTGKDPDAGKDWGQEEKGMTEDEMVGGITNSVDMSLSKLWQTVKDEEAWRDAVHGVTKSQTWLNDWTELNRTDVDNSSLILMKKKFNGKQIVFSTNAGVNYWISTYKK